MIMKLYLVLFIILILSVEANLHKHRKIHKRSLKYRAHKKQSYLTFEQDQYAPLDLNAKDTVTTYYTPAHQDPKPYYPSELSQEESEQIDKEQHQNQYEQTGDNFIKSAISVEREQQQEKILNDQELQQYKLANIRQDNIGDQKDQRVKENASQQIDIKNSYDDIDQEHSEQTKDQNVPSNNQAKSQSKVQGQLKQEGGGLGPLSSNAHKITGAPGDGKLPQQYGNWKSEQKFWTFNNEGSHESLGGFGNNIPHYMVVNNKINGVHLKDPVKVNSLHYFNEPNANIDGVQSAEDNKKSPTDLYYAPTEGLMADPVMCLYIKNPNQCFQNENCGWCGDENPFTVTNRCIPGTAHGPSKLFVCDDTFSYNSFKSNQSVSNCRFKNKMKKFKRFMKK